MKAVVLALVGTVGLAGTAAAQPPGYYHDHHHHHHGYGPRPVPYYGPAYYAPRPVLVAPAYPPPVAVVPAPVVVAQPPAYGYYPPQTGVSFGVNRPGFSFGLNVVR